MYYRLINDLDWQPHSTGYNSTSTKELVDGIYDLLGDEYFEYDLDSINLTALERSKNVQTVLPENRRIGCSP